MNLRERFLNTFHYEEVDRVPDFEFGYWQETLENWVEEGHLPQQIIAEGEGDINRKAEEYFGFEQRETLPVSVDMHPHFERKVLDEDEKYRIVRDERGIVCRILKEHETMPEWIEFPVKDREDFERLKERYDPSDPARYPDDWESLGERYRDRERPLGVFCGSLYGWLRYWTGFERLSRAFIQEPDFVHDMMEFLTEHILTVLSRALKEAQRQGVTLDFSAWWEDMCYNKGPLISPDMFEEFMVPRYKRITSLLEDYGIDIHYLDSDGQIDELVPLWLEGGINCMFPIEVAHTKPEDLREKFGKEVLMMGGVDKRALIEGTEEAIDDELAKLPPLLEEGGFIPHVDHRVPADVDFESYRYYVRRKREIIGRD